MKQNDVDDDDVDEDEMRLLVPSMPDQRNGIRKQDEMIRRVKFQPLAVSNFGMTKHEM